MPHIKAIHPVPTGALALILGAAVAAIIVLNSYPGEAPESVMLAEVRAVNDILSTENTDNGLKMRFGRNDAWVELPFKGRVERRYLEILVAHAVGLADVTVYYGLKGIPYDVKRSWTSRLRFSGDRLEAPLMDGVYDRIRIDFNATGERGGIQIRSVRALPVETSRIRGSAIPMTLRGDEGAEASVRVEPGESFFIRNIGDSLIFNPRFVAEGGLDTSSYNALLSSLTRGESFGPVNREELLLRAWRYLGSEITHHCSPGREGVSVIDVLDLVGGYGFGCCSHTNRALVRLADHLGFNTRFVSTEYHEYPEIELARGWQIVDANRGKRWFARNGDSPLVGLPDSSGSAAMATATGAVYENPDGDLIAASGDTLAEEIRDHTDRLVAVQTYPVHAVNPQRRLVLHPGDSIYFHTDSAQPPLFHDYDGVSPPHGGLAVLSTVVDGGRGGVDSDPDGSIRRVRLTVPLPVLSVTLSATGGDQASIRSVRLASGTGARRLGDAWVLSSRQLDGPGIEREIDLLIDGDAPSIALTINMLYNPRMFGIRIFGRNGEIVSEGPRTLYYRDDDADCRRRIEVGAGPMTQDLARGNRKCLVSEHEAPSNRDYYRRDISRVVRYASGCRITRNGIEREPGEHCDIVLALPKGPYTSARLKMAGADRFNWSTWDGEGWRAIEPLQFGFNRFIEIDGIAATDDHLLVRIEDSRDGARRRLLSRGFSYEQGPATLRPAFFGAEPEKESRDPER